MDRTLECFSSLQPDYPDVGATIRGDSPPGFTHDKYERDLGYGAEIFEPAKQGLMTWRAHEQPGIHVYPADAIIRPGATVVVALGVGIAIAAPCRVIKVIDEPRSWGFSYATLPGHPEKGEESFIISSLDDGTVQFAIEAVSRPSDPLVRLVSPISRYVQRRASEGYLDSLQRYVDRSISL